MFEKTALEQKVTFHHAPFPGDAPALTATLGGHVMVGVTGAQAWTSHVTAGSNGAQGHSRERGWHRL